MGILINSLNGSITTVAGVIDLSTFPNPYTVTLLPGSGNTAQVEYSTTPTAVLSPASATWHLWPSGIVSLITNDTFLGKLTALRITRVTGASNPTLYEIVS